jgi:M6 family metalloprotease-like protein
MKRASFQPWLYAAALSLALAACKLPDQVGPDDNFCTAGASVLTVNDDAVPADVKNQIYNPIGGSGIISLSNPAYNSSGKVVLIPISFPDLPANDALSNALISDFFFSSGTGSVRDYFQENSWGQFNVSNGGISSWAALPQTPAQYGVGQVGNDWTRNPNVARDACVNSSINWDALDVNNDNRIDPQEALICFIVPAGGCGANRPSSFTASTQFGDFTFNNRFTFFDCKRNDNPTKGTDEFRYNGPCGFQFSTIVHELSHGFFGLPDRYSSACGTGTTGPYDLMADNCSMKHLTIYDKMKIGWIRPRILTESRAQRRCYSFPAIEQTPAALILYNSRKPGEYWIVENRDAASSPRNFESGLPESGLALWWVDGSSDSPRLVNASDPAQRPDSYTNPGAGWLFRYRGDDPEDLTLFLHRDGSLGMGLRAVSEPGNVMYCEF